jgi:hypothetical protein
MQLVLGAIPTKLDQKLAIEAANTSCLWRGARLFGGNP